LKDIFQLRAGESICYENKSLKKTFYTRYLTDVFSDKNREELKEALKTVIETVGKRMIKALDGRPVAIPLSGGFDSRMVAWLLKKNNYPNVICFTYGKQNTPEQKNARQTAANLGYDWHFIDYAKYADYRFSQDDEFKEYVDFSANYTNKFYLQEYFALKELRNQKIIPENTVFISGHSGAVAGHLLTKEMLATDFSYVDHALNEVFGLVYPHRKDLKLIRKDIDYLNNYEKKYPSYLIYESWRFQETTVKMGINASKLWDFSGYEYLLPLWDRELYHFFLHVPLQHKYDKNLYTETLIELFEELGIYFHDEELFPPENVIKKVAFRSKIKKQFPILKRFINLWKNDIQGSQSFSHEFRSELKKSNNDKKFLSVNGIYSAWYVEMVRKKLE
jgi:asparagine synthase (glutamine-hydrolysing)